MAMAKKHDLTTLEEILVDFDVEWFHSTKEKLNRLLSQIDKKFSNPPLICENGTPLFTPFEAISTIVFIFFLPSGVDMAISFTFSNSSLDRLQLFELSRPNCSWLPMCLGK